MPASMRNFLRSATRKQHEQLDDLMGVYSLDEREGFRETLLIHARALDPVANRLLTDPVVSRAPAYPLVPSCRMQALHADLMALESQSPGVHHAVCPDAAADPVSNAFLHGAQYVTAGSHLGLAALSRQHRNSRWMQASAFVQWPGGHEHWRATLERLENGAWSDEHFEQTREGAAWMFNRYLSAVHKFSSTHE